MSDIEKELLIKLAQSAKQALVLKNYVVVSSILGLITDILATTPNEKPITKDS